MSNRIGRFEIQSEISRSPVGTVYKATDTTSNETVALKTIRLESLGQQAAELVKRILQEVEKSKALNSPNAALLNGAGEIDGLFCASTEYVQGNSIATMLARNEGFSIWDLQDIARQACQGLDHAQYHGLGHHSLEPAKIMVQWDGMVKILAFGVSSMGEYAIFVPGPAPELLHYMSPEQLHGDAIDVRSNLFSLGATFYEMLTDKKAFGGETADAVRLAISEAAPTPPHQLNAKIPAALSAVIMKALAKKPEDRYQSGKDLLIDLERSKSAATAPQAPATMPGATSNSGGRSTTKAAAAGAGSTNTARTQLTPASNPMGATAKPNAMPKPQGQTSSVGAAEAQTPRIAIDPLVDERVQNSRAQSRSFSEIDELPPLQEVRIPERPTPAALGSSEFRSPSLKRAATPPPKAKVQPGVIAKKAVAEVKKTPPKLFFYSIAGAIVFILLVIGIVTFHFSGGSGEEDARPAQGQATVKSGVTTGTAVASDPTLGPASPVISVKPKENSRRRSRVTANASAPAVAGGQLNVNSTPEGAQFQIDGRQDAKWITPSVAGLAAGQHTVSVTKSGYRPETRSLDISSGAKSVFVVQLEALFATAVIASEPAGAAVFVDGKDTGRVTPIQVRIDTPGSHTFLLRKQGYLEESATADLQSGQTVRLSPTLKVLGNTDDIRIGGKFKKLFGGGDTAGMASITVKTQPKGAQVAVNRHVLDKNSPVEFHLEPGNYVIDITLAGYKSVHKVLTLERNGKESIDETLEHE
ncbi:MAG: hypothetical protein NVS1B11_22270 [Terriglobales bacterium]